MDKYLLTEDEIKELINEELYSKGLITEEIYLKWGVKKIHWKVRNIKISNQKYPEFSKLIFYKMILEL